ncbi:MAG: substrate-binding and vWA domain-containing protein [Anaerolineae bacterium]
MTTLRKALLLVLLCLLVLPLHGCGGERPALRIVSGSENKPLEPIIQRFARQNGVRIEIDYKGSLDIMLLLGNSDPGYDAVWPANSLWIALGDTRRIVKNSESIMRSPVILGVRRSVAERLDWVGRDVKVEDILQAAESGRLRMMMTSATQSNSGASAYFGYLYAFAGNPEVLTAEHLQDPQVRDKIKRILGTINRSSESSGFLKDLFLAHYDQYDAMVNYEAVVIEANQQLVSEGREPLYAVYPADGLAIADSPLGYVDRGDAKKRALFDKLQAYLLSDAVQKEILSHGRRTGMVGLTPRDVDPKVFNPDWGIDVQRVIVPIKFPQAQVIREALDLYQTAFRKGSFTVYCLDFSGSMGENRGSEQLKQAMKTLLDQQTARQYLLQASPDDINVVLLFNHKVINRTEVEQWTVQGNDPARLQELYRRIEAHKPNGNTNIYDPVIMGLEIMQQKGLGNRLPAIILMTDGMSNTGSYDDLTAAWQRLGLNVPVYAITFGDADVSQLKGITALTAGHIFDGRKDLIAAFRKARGSN